MKEQIFSELYKNKNIKLSKFTLKKTLNIKDKKNDKFEDSLKELLKENVIIKNKKHKYSLNNKYKLYVGHFNTNNNGNFVYITQNENSTLNEPIKKILIEDENYNYIFNGDTVIVDLIDENNAIILSVIKRKIKNIIGTYIPVNEREGIVIPENKELNIEIIIDNKDDFHINGYDKVLVSITQYPNKKKKAKGVIKQVLGFQYNYNNDYKSIISQFNIVENFTPKTIKQVEKISDKISPNDLINRVDLTNKCIFTIDGENSKDLDDAISIEKKDGLYKLGIHIADVSHYIPENSSLDNEALNRGTSVYLINKVIPMLPKKLSNNLCSLKPFETKLTLSVFMDINNNGEVVNYKICESYIQSKSKLYYKNVSDFLEYGKDLILHENAKNTNIQNEIENSLKIAFELQKILEKKRINRGSLNFDFKESEIKLDNNNVPISVKPYEIRIGNKIIEEFMIITNETVAYHFNKIEIPFVYRIHEKPCEEKLTNFINYIKDLDEYKDMNIISDISPKELQKILEMTNGETINTTINLMLLKCLKQAKYSPIEIGHYALATPYYSHFTSPIRRYPDLQIHRIIKDYLNNRLNLVRIEELKYKVKKSSNISSIKERDAQQAEITYENLKKAEYMLDKIDMEFIGTITQVSKQYCNIVLSNTIEGIILLNKIDDSFEILQEDCIIRGINSNVKFVVGMVVNVVLKKVVLEEQLIIFDFKKGDE